MTFMWREKKNIVEVRSSGIKGRGLKLSIFICQCVWTFDLCVFLCTSEMFFEDFLVEKQNLNSLYQESHCKRVLNKNVGSVLWMYLSRVSNMYSFSVYKYIYISIIWAVVKSGGRGVGRIVSGPHCSYQTPLLENYFLICTVSCDHVFNDWKCDGISVAPNPMGPSPKSCAKKPQNDP